MTEYLKSLGLEVNQTLIFAIARSLSRIDYFNGVTQYFYTMAQHSIHVSNLVKGYEYDGLMYNTAKILIGNLPKALNQNLNAYQALEMKIAYSLASIFEFRLVLPEVKNADAQALRTAKKRLLPLAPNWNELEKSVEAFSGEILTSQLAEEAFLQKFFELAPIRIIEKINLGDNWKKIEPFRKGRLASLKRPNKILKKAL